MNKLTLLDYPGHTACIFFTPGCNFRCGYCHNPEFVLPQHLCYLQKSFIPEATVLTFLRERQGRLEGVVITGGEPTIQPDLEQFLRKVKTLGFLVKLDTNGNKPEVLKKLITEKLIDYVAMDVKTSLVEYPHLVGKLVNVKAIQASIKLLKKNVVDYEFRTTLVKEKHSRQVLAEMRNSLRGAKRFFLQTFRSGIVLDPMYAHCTPYSRREMDKVRNFFGTSIAQVEIRE